MEWKNLSCLITGGAGFIGSNLAEALSAQGAKVTIIDDFSTGHESNLENLKESNTRIIKGSILDETLLKSAFNGIDLVFHQAALPSVPRSIEDPLSSNEVNITGTLRVLEASRIADVRKVVYAASSSAYGETEILPKVETMYPLPLSPYAVNKLASEYYCKVYNDVYNLPTTSLRYFNVYGPKQDPNSQYSAVIPKFITSILTDKSPEIYGDGLQSRDFTFVADAVQANMKAAISDKSNGEVINIAFGERTTLNDLVSIICDITGKNIAPIHIKPREGDILHSLADISSARKLISYDPDYDLRKGLKETIKFFSSEK
jgi:nucleoside-diphosphate-sugar epimerase